MSQTINALTLIFLFASSSAVGAVRFETGELVRVWRPTVSEEAKGIRTEAESHLLQLRHCRESGWECETEVLMLAGKFRVPADLMKSSSEEDMNDAACLNDAIADARIFDIQPFSWPAENIPYHQVRLTRVDGCPPLSFFFSNAGPRVYIGFPIY